MARYLHDLGMLELKFGKRKVVKYRGAMTVVGGLSPKNKIDILLYVGKELAHINEPTELFSKVIELCSDIFESDNVTVRVWEDRLLRPVAFLQQTEPERRPLAAGEGFSGMIFAEQKSFLIDDLQRHPEYLDSGEKTLCVICVPISFQDEKIGTLSVEKNLSHSYKKDDLEILEAMAAQIALALLNARLISGMRAAQKIQEKLNSQMQFDLKIGRVVQAQIVRREFAPFKAIDLHSLYEPMVEVSGDYYDAYRSKNSLTIILADVSGHGVPAALVTMALHYHFQSLAAQGLSLIELLAQLSRMTKSILPTGIYFTCQLIRIHGDYSFSFVNAGHPKLLHFSAVNAVLITEYDTKGLLIGIADFSIEDYEEVSGKIRPGETLVMLTDGLYEQRGSDGKETGMERVIGWLSQSLTGNDQNLETLLQNYNTFRGAHAVDDDVTLLTVHYALSHIEADILLHQSRKAIRGRDFESAWKAIHEALSLRPSHAEALGLAGKLSLHEKKFEIAEDYLKRANEIEDDNLEILILTGHASMKAGSLTNAKRAFKQVLEREPQNIQASLLLTKAYLKSDERGKALRTVQAALKYAPHHEKLTALADFLKRKQGVFEVRS